MLARILVVVPFLFVSLAAQETAPSKSDKAKKPPTLDGVFRSTANVDLSLDMESWSGKGKVIQVVKPGTLVKSGDVILRLECKGLEEACEKAAFEMKQAVAEYELTRREKELGLDAAKQAIDGAGRALDWAKRKLTKAVDHDLANQKISDALTQEASNHRLEDQQDELDQLHKMYKEDELVDATEKIVVKRSERRLSMSKKRVDLARKRREATPRLRRQDPSGAARVGRPQGESGV